MSEGIVHSAIVDDVSRVITVHPRIYPLFGEALCVHSEIARLGGIARHGDRHNPRLLAQLRESAPYPPRDIRLAKLAFVLGWLSHRAADRQFKPIFHGLDADCPHSPTDCSIYHDVFILRAVYAGGDECAFSRDLLSAAETSGAEAVERLLRTYWQRMLLAMHTFIPDDENIDLWLDRLMQTYQAIRVDLRRYAEVWTRPNPDKLRRFVEEPHFYTAEDSIIRLARSVQRGVKVSEEEVREALKSARHNESLYARALRRALGYIEAASEYFERRIGEEELRQRLEIGRPELAG